MSFAEFHDNKSHRHIFTFLAYSQDLLTVEPMTLLGDFIVSNKSNILEFSTDFSLIKRKEVSRVSSSGFCSKCKKVHNLKDKLAVYYCYKLMNLFSSKKRIDLVVSNSAADSKFSTNYLFGKAKGMMFGIMIFQDQNGTMGVMPAFSGQYNGVWEVEGWAPPLFNTGAFNKITRKVDQKIKEISDKINTLNENSTERNDLVHFRKSMSQNLMKEIHGLYKLTNFCGKTKSIYEVFLGSNGIPNGAGDCCAPKLLNYAAVNKLMPIGIAEFYWGKENLSKTRQSGKFYKSCREKCQPILGFMLCGLG